MPQTATITTITTMQNPLAAQPVSPRIAEMIKQLYDFQDVINRCKAGHVEIHFSQKEVSTMLKNAQLGRIST